MAFVLLCLSGSGLSAQESAAQRHQMATNQLKRVAAEMSARCLEDVRTLDDWTGRRAELRRQLLEMLGLDPVPRRTPLRVRVSKGPEREGYRIERIVFQSLPGLYVTGDFYLPRPAAGPAPSVLYLCGHSPNPRGAKVEYQDRGAWFAAHGFPCFVLDTLEFGEVPGIHHGTHNLNMWHWLSLGYTPAGVEVWNAMRALDYMQGRPEVDGKRIGLTGISGGGAMTWYTAAVDERVAAAVPVCSTFTFGSQAGQWLASGQCDCIYYHNTYLQDFPAVAALIAPRPLLILSGRKDTIFPPDGYHEAFRRVRRIYDLYAGAASDRVRELDDDVPHSDPPLFLREARQWMRRWLKGDPAPLPLETNGVPAEDPVALACLDRLPADAANFRIQNEFTAQAPLRDPGSRAAWEKRRSELMGRLRDKVFRWFPRQGPPFETREVSKSGGYMPRYADYRDVSFQTEEGVRIRAQWLTPRGGRPDAPLLIYVKRAGDSIYFMDTDELLPLLGRFTVLILSPRFTEVSLSAADTADIERTAAWVGRTMAAIQVWDILRAVRWALEEGKLSPDSISLYGKGDMGICALYAALFDERIRAVILNDPPGTHRQRPALLNVLRLTDIPEAAGALAPRRLVFLTEPPGAFALAERIYRLEKASGNFRRSASLPEALRVWEGGAASARP